MGYDLNSGTVLDMLERGYEQTAPLEEATKEGFKGAEVVHFDETGIHVAGKLYWLHTASTGERTHLFVHEKRGEEALASAPSVLKDFQGKAVHDCLAAYFKFDVLLHVLCGAHLLRALKGLIEDGRVWAKDMHEFLLDLYNRPHPMGAADEIRQHYRIILEQADQEEPPPIKGQRGRPKQSPGRNLLDRLRTYHDGVLAFARQAGVPFTNNQAERDLRPAKVKLKVKGQRLLPDRRGRPDLCPYPGDYFNLPQAGSQGLYLTASGIFCSCCCLVTRDVGSYQKWHKWVWQSTISL
nr:transposase [Candidatus Thiosymbion oneisti]